jgi:CRP-like cAMP-binding protein
MKLNELTQRLGATTLFSPLSREQLQGLLERSPKCSAKAGNWLAEQPKGLCHHLVVLAGDIEVQRTWIGDDGVEKSHTRRVVVERDGPGFALLEAAGSQLCLRALLDSEYLMIDPDELADLLGWFQLGAFVLPEPHLKVFHRLPLESVAIAINRLVERPVAAGEIIVRQGEPGDHYYVILSGEAEVWQLDDDTGMPTMVNRLVDGDSFGEEALLADSVRTASVTMVSAGSLLVLCKADFEALLGPAMVEEVDVAAAKSLLGSGSARPLDCRNPAEHASIRIPGSVLAPLTGLRHEAASALEPGVTYIAYCDTGRRSRVAAFLLRERGIQAMSLIGGLSLWPYEMEGAKVQELGAP